MCVLERPLIWLMRKIHTYAHQRVDFTRATSKTHSWLTQINENYCHLKRGRARATPNCITVLHVAACCSTVAVCVCVCARQRKWMEMAIIWYVNHYLFSASFDFLFVNLISRGMAFCEIAFTRSSESSRIFPDVFVCESVHLPALVSCLAIVNYFKPIKWRVLMQMPIHNIDKSFSAIGFISQCGQFTFST